MAEATDQRESLPPPSRRTCYGAPAVPTWSARTRVRLERLFWHLGVMAEMTLLTGRAAFRRPFEWRAIVQQLHSLGVASVGIVSVTSVFIGMVMAVQFAYGLRVFGGMEYTGRVMAISFTRELAPTLTAVIVGGRIGSGMAAEVGSMAVTEQIDAVRALGADPFKKLVLPRLIASILVMPMLAAFALVLGFGGAMFITDVEFHIPAGFYLRSGLDQLFLRDFLQGIFKTPFFGAIIALVGCHFGPDKPVPTNPSQPRQIAASDEHGHQG
ncbi:MlaE family ABC transporter permease [Myxococcota bacterium]